MPHCVIEHAASLDAGALVPAVFAAAKSAGLFEPDGADIKVRAIAYDHYLTGPAKSDFVHVSIRLLSGRTVEQKQLLSQAVLAQLQTLALPRCSLTVEVIDIERASYAKVITS